MYSSDRRRHENKVERRVRRGKSGRKKKRGEHGKLNDGGKKTEERGEHRDAGGSWKKSA